MTEDFQDVQQDLDKARRKRRLAFVVRAALIVAALVALVFAMRLGGAKICSTPKARACESSKDCDSHAEIQDSRRYNKTYATMCYLSAEKISLCRWRGDDCPRPIYSDETRTSVCRKNVCTSAGWF